MLRDRFTSLSALSVALLIGVGVSAADVPVQGAGKSFPEFDAALIAHLEKSRCTAATPG